ncbi:phosphatidylinositol transfer protein 1-like [Phoenix dactylifera]|uniref:Phosphatidylinositol transfer protein 1-like n=1 Tax=Phoenix dactylifera TaxID=42345 RepID=A0A8B7C5G2_PHODC|nr:phosphatidylinositol transfer protein 1-like [Phoenix dactylifera]
MVQIKEFRIVMPMSLEEYEVAMMYTIMKMEQLNTTSKEGVEIVQNIPFEDELLGKGQYTSKIYHLQSKIPGWLKTVAPTSALTVQEESWSSYPKSKTAIKCPFFARCSLTIETVSKADNGCSENVHGLSNELLAARKVEVIDIASVSRDYWSKAIGTTKLDLSTFKSQRTGRGPLLKGWEDTCHPVMTAYKLVTVEAPIWGFGGRLEEAVLAAERALFWGCHKLCFAWIDEWFGMTMDQVCELERENDLLLNKRLQKSYSVSGKRDDKRKSLHGSKKIIEHPIKL